MEKAGSAAGSSKSRGRYKPHPRRSRSYDYEDMSEKSDKSSAPEALERHDSGKDRGKAELKNEDDIRARKGEKKKGKGDYL